MTGQLVIKPQHYPEGVGPLSYGVFLETEEVIDGLDHWQDCESVFVCYSWTSEGAARAVRELSLRIQNQKEKANG